MYNDHVTSQTDVLAKIATLHRFQREGFAISLLKDDRCVLFGSQKRAELTDVVRTYPNAQAQIDCTLYGQHGELVLVTIDPEVDNKKRTIFEVLEKAGVSLPGTLHHKNLDGHGGRGLVYSVKKGEAGGYLCLAPGVELCSVTSIPVVGIDRGDVAELPHELIAQSRTEIEKSGRA